MFWRRITFVRNDKKIKAQKGGSTMNDITFNILKIVITIATALISAYVIPLLKEKLKDAKYQSLLEIVGIAVRAAEQTIKGSGQGAVKKDEVITFVTDWMVRHGISITQDQLDQLIECCVYNLKLEAK
jgi:LL-H family phage holin